MFGLQPRERIVGIGTQRRDAHQADELQRLGGLHLGAQFIDQVRAPDVDSAARDVAVEADLDVDPQRVGPAARRPAPGRLPGRAR